MRAFVLVLLLLLPLPASAQLVLPGLQGEGVGIPLVVDRRTALAEDLGEREAELLRRLDREQAGIRWQQERLESRRKALADDEKRWSQRRNRLPRSSQRREVLERLLQTGRELDALLRSLEEDYDAELQALADVASGARALRRELEADESDTTRTGTQLDELLGAAEGEAQQARQRLEELEAKREALQDTIEAHRRQLEEARFAPLPFIAPPESTPDEATPGAEGGEGIEIAFVPPPPPVLTEAEQELLGYEEEARRLGIRRLERQVDRDRRQLALLDVAAQREDMQLGLLELRLEEWGQKRDAVAIRESDGIFALGDPLLSPGVFERAAEHTRSLLERPGETLERVGATISRDAQRQGSPPGPGLYFALALLGGLSVLLVARLLRVLRGWAPKGDSDALVRSVLIRVLPVLPVSVICGVLAGFELVPNVLRPLYRFSAVAPPLAALAIVIAGGLFPAGGSDSVSPVVSRYLRSLVRAGVVFACGIRLMSVLAPLFGYPEDVSELVRAGFVGWLVLGWLGIALRRREVLGLLGEGDATSNVSILRRGVARLYRVLVLGPVFLFGLHAMGYLNLTRLLLRGGLVTLGVVLLAPWLHARLRSATEWALGFPDGGGLLALTAKGSRAAYRTAAPLLLLFVGGLSLALLAAGWDYQGNVFSNLLDAVQQPIVRIGGSDVTGFSLGAMMLSAGATILVTRWVVGGLNRVLYPLYDLDGGTRATLNVLTRYTLYGVGVLIGLKIVKVGPAVLSLFAGVLGIGIGFGSQTLAANFIAGLILLLSRRVSVGDVIEVEGTTGRVVRISTLATVVQTLDNLMVVVPNAHMIDGAVINWTGDDDSVRLAVVVGVAYGSDVPLVRRLLLEACAADTRVLKRPVPRVRFDDFGDSALTFTMLPWIDEPDDRFMIASDLRYRVNLLFAEHGVEIAFPQVDVHLRGAEGTVRLAPPKDD